MGEHSHGYCEYVLWLKNHSSTQGHRVTLVLPSYSFGYSTLYLHDVTRTVEVGPDALVRVPLWQPSMPALGGRDLSVVIDGTRQDTIFPLRVVNGRGTVYGGRGGGPPLLVMTSTGVKPDFSGMVAGMSGFGGGGTGFMGPGGAMPGMAPPGGAPLPGGGMPGMAPGAGGPPAVRTRPGGAPPAPGGAPAPPAGGGAAMGGPQAADPFELPEEGAPGAAPPGGPGIVVPIMPRISSVIYVVQSPLPVTRWTSAWLGLSRYDGIVLTADELRVMPTGAQTALWQYVECGGCLLVLGQATLPDSWKPEQPQARKDGDLVSYRPGFGICLVSKNGDYAKWGREPWRKVATAWEQTAFPWRNVRTQVEANKQFPVLNDMGIPVRGLFFLMIVFTIAIGPVNVMLLSRRKRRIWLLWTVPSISLATCIAVFGYMLIAEGWRGTWRADTLTVLDHGSHRATTIGWTAFYSPLTPRDGLHFSTDTELTMQCFEDMYRRRRSTTPCSMSWSEDQHLTRGWVAARVPSHFMVRKSEVRRERVSISHEKDGAPVMVNSLGVPIVRLWYADERGRIHTAEDVPAGSRVSLKADGSRVDAKKIEPLRTVFSGDWLGAFRHVQSAPTALLSPRTYVAEVEAAPFLEEALARTRTQKCHSLILGILHEKDDEG
jgi:hypothetical protein